MEQRQDQGLRATEVDTLAAEERPGMHLAQQSPACSLAAAAENPLISDQRMAAQRYHTVDWQSHRVCFVWAHQSYCTVFSSVRLRSGWYRCQMTARTAILLPAATQPDNHTGPHEIRHLCPLPMFHRPLKANLLWIPSCGPVSSRVRQFTSSRTFASLLERLRVKKLIAADV